MRGLSTNWWFLLTRPIRDVTVLWMMVTADEYVSTHTPHAGRDWICAEKNGDLQVSTHTPHAGRDYAPGCVLKKLPVSTHTPHAGRDINDLLFHLFAESFYSHAPCGT